MKLCAVVLFTVSVALVCADHGNGKGGPLKEIFVKCMEENKVDKETLLSDQDNPNPPTEVKCVLACVLEKLGAMKNDGSPNQAGADKIIAKMPERIQEKLKPAIQECMKVLKGGLAKCESGWLAMRCMKEKMPHHKGGHKPKHSSEESG